MPAHVTQHHLRRQDLRARIDVVLAGVLRRRAVGRLEHRDRVAHVGTRGDADAADLGGERVGDVVAVEVERRDHRVLGRAQQDLLQEGVGDDVLDDDLLAALRVLELAPRTAVDLGRLELPLREPVAPVAEGPFRELHDVALVDERHRGLVVIDRVLDRLSDQPLRALARDRLDADPRGRREADLLDAEVVLQDLDEALGLVAFGLELDAGVDVFRVLAEDHHVGLLGLLDRRGDSLEILDRPQAHVEIELLAQGDVERTDAAADRRRQRALDRDHVVAQDLERLGRQPDVGAVDAGRLLAGVDLHPVDLLLAAEGLGDRRVDHLDHHRGDVEARAVALDVGNDRLVRHRQREVGVDLDLLPGFGHLDVLIHENGAPLGAAVVAMQPEILSRMTHHE